MSWFLCKEQILVCVCALSVSDPDKRLQALWVTCDCLPKNHKANLRWDQHSTLFYSVLLYSPLVYSIVVYSNLL